MDGTQNSHSFKIIFLIFKRGNDSVTQVDSVTQKVSLCVDAATDEEAFQSPVILFSDTLFRHVLHNEDLWK